MSAPRVALVIPTIREDSFTRFIREWKETGLFDLVDLIVMEDNPVPTFKIDLDVPYTHLAWSDIEENWWSHIIPRRSDTVRSYAYWWAWNAGYEFLMTLDDDCYPAEGFDLVADHLAMLTGRSKWYNTLNNVIPRGMPYYNRGERKVYVNHGIWKGVLDYDAPHQLVNPVPEVYDYSNRIVPGGAYFPFCGMNWMCRREAIPLMYHMLMGSFVVDIDESTYKTQKYDFDRFGDIWCGIVMKKIADHLGWAVSTGTPYIHHDRASSPFANLRKEANGIEVNEWFWEKIDQVSLVGDDPAYCYTQIGIAVYEFGGEHSEYWHKLGLAMQDWASLFVVRSDTDAIPF